MPVVVVPGVPDGTIEDPWATTDDMTGCAELVADHPVEAAVALDAASWLLFRLSGERYGLRTVTLRPCRQTCAPATPVGTGWTPSGWYPTTFSCSCSPRRCACGEGQADRVKVPRPVQSVTEVIVDGAVLDDSAYRIDTRRRDAVLRIDGDQWPTCQNESAAEDEDGYFAMTVSWGVPVPAIGVSAVADLACWSLDSMFGEGCLLPDRATSVSRGGISVPMLDLADLIDKRRTGIASVDLFLTAANPNRLARRARAFSAENL